MNHKWLTDEPAKEIEILAVPTTMPTENLTIKSEDETPVSDEDKENSIKNSDNVDKSPSTNINHTNTTTNINNSSAKLVLEKSHSISLFPDAPTTPKVCRKALYDDEDDLKTQVKEIVKKYQTSESQQQQHCPCCGKETSGDCLICRPKNPSSKPPSLDNGIIC